MCSCFPGATAAANGRDEGEHLSLSARCLCAASARKSLEASASALLARELLQLHSH